MLNFPLPYPDELIYSVLARAGVHLGLKSPKQLLDAVFANRHVSASVDLPGQLGGVLALWPIGLGISAEELAYRHTLFPLYAPFAAECHRQQCLDKMVSATAGIAHRILGLAASRVRQPTVIRYCPACQQRQLKKYGEYYWLRQWQVAAADCCLEHGCLINSHIERQAYHRHQFFPAIPDCCPACIQPPASQAALRITRQVSVLLQIAPAKSASFAQWQYYYQHLAQALGYCRGRQIHYPALCLRVTAHWSQEWLMQHGLGRLAGEDTWLHAMFRKHRKAFSYLEHIVVLDALLPSSWCIAQVLCEVGNLPDIGSRIVSVPTACAVETASSELRTQWLALLKQGSVNQQRNIYGALYAWLYRHDRAWLLAINHRLRVQKVIRRSRVDWHQRDMSCCRQLIRIRNEHELALESPRWTRSWYWSQLLSRPLLTKHMNDMPLTRQFFARYCETVADYQLRRLAYARRQSGEPTLARWRWLRAAHLSEERLTEQARWFLDHWGEDDAKCAL